MGTACSSERDGASGQYLEKAADDVVIPETVIQPTQTHISSTSFHSVVVSQQVSPLPLPNGNGRPQVQSLQLTHQTKQNEEVLSEESVPIIIKWNGGTGREVAVEGSWDGWANREFLRKAGNDFFATKLLCSGVYHCRFTVDGQWRNNPSMPLAYDELGNGHNILIVQDGASKLFKNLPVVQSSSLKSSYNCTFDDSFYEMKPPLLPPQLPATVLNVPVPTCGTEHSLPVPSHATLNHLYVKEKRSDPPVIVLGSTERFLEKYVTVELYKRYRFSAFPKIVILSF